MRRTNKLIDSSSVPGNVKATDGSFFYQNDRWHLNAFSIAGQMLVSSPFTVDCRLIDGDDETHSLYQGFKR